MNLKLGVQVRELELQHGYYSDAWWRARRNAGKPCPHEAAPAVRIDSRAMVPDWRTGLAPAEDQLREQFDADLAAEHPVVRLDKEI